jgi:hypothetical protein
MWYLIWSVYVVLSAMFAWGVACLLDALEEGPEL